MEKAIRKYSIAMASGTHKCCLCYCRWKDVTLFVRVLLNEGIMNMMPVLLEYLQSSPKDHWPLVAVLLLYVDLLVCFYSSLRCLNFDLGSHQFLLFPFQFFGSQPKNFVQAIMKLDNNTFLKLIYLLLDSNDVLATDKIPTIINLYWWTYA